MVRIGNRISETDPLGHTTSHAYASGGHTVTIVDEVGNNRTRTCGKQGLIESVVTPLVDPGAVSG